MATEDVEETEEERFEKEELPANTSSIASSSERRMSRYTSKLPDAQPPVRIISESVAPEFRIAVAEPRRKHCDEYFPPLGFPVYLAQLVKYEKSSFPAGWEITTPGLCLVDHRFPEAMNG